MLEPIYTNLFKKELKLMGKQGRDIDKIGEIMNMLINEKPLPSERRNHPLHGKWKDSYDCHIQGDWILIYEPDKKANTITFHRTGSHSELF